MIKQRKSIKLALNSLAKRSLFFHVSTILIKKKIATTKKRKWLCWPYIFSARIPFFASLWLQHIRWVERKNGNCFGNYIYVTCSRRRTEFQRLNKFIVTWLWLLRYFPWRLAFAYTFGLNAKTKCPGQRRLYIIWGENPN